MNDIKVISFVVYNNKFNKEGDEEKKIMFYYPENEKLVTKVNNIGLFEALAQYTSSFYANKPCQLISTERRKYVFHNPEENYWMVITLAAVNEGVLSNGKIKYLDDSLKSIYQAVLKSWYGRFCMLYEGFETLAQSRGMMILMEKLRRFFKRQIKEVEEQNCDLLTTYGGLHYKQLSCSNFLEFHSVLSSLQDKVSNIQYCLAMYDRFMIFSNLDKNNTINLVSILKSHSSALQHSRFSRPDQSIGGISTYQLQHGGRCCLGIFEGSKNCNLIYLNQNKKQEKLQIIIYKAYNITICLLLDKLELPFTDTIKKVDAQLGPQLLTFSTKLQNVSALTAEPAPYSNMQYIHFEKNSLSVESTCHSFTNSHQNKCIIPRQAMKVICHLEEIFTEHSLSDDVELICKVQNEYWVGAKSNLDQEIFVAGTPKISNLIQFNEEAQKLVSKFDGLSFAD